MDICERCGNEFDLTQVKRSINRRFGAGTYDDYFNGGGICGECALEQISADYATGQELRELMGDWDDD